MHHHAISPELLPPLKLIDEHVPEMILEQSNLGNRCRVSYFNEA